MNFIKFSIPVSSIPIIQPIDKTILKYKIYEKVTWKVDDAQKAEKISGDGFDCTNI